MIDSRTPEQIWEAAYKATIKHLQEWGYEFRPFVKMPPYDSPQKLKTSPCDTLKIVRIKPEFELEGQRGMHYRVLIQEKGIALLKWINDYHPEGHKFWIDNNKITAV